LYRKKKTTTTHLYCIQFSGTKNYCAHEIYGSRCINREEKGVIKGYVVSTHHSLAAKLGQIC